MNPPRATLGGIPLTNVGSVGWSETVGVEPAQATFTFHKSQESALDKIMGKAVDLVVSSDTAPTFTWKGLYPLRKIPSAVPYHVTVQVADVRWKWPRVAIHTTYNLFRKTGVRRIVAGQVIELATQRDDYLYVTATLKDQKKKWTAKEVPGDVLARIAAACGHGWRQKKMPVGEGLAVESLDLSDGGNGAMARALSLVPGLDVKIDKSGDAVLFDATDYQAATDALGDRPATVKGQIDAKMDLRHVRPSKIRVYFWREVELRFDSADEGDDPSATVQAGPGADNQSLMDNVLPLPDPNTTIDGEQYGQGTWVTVKQALAAWDADLATLVKPVKPPALNVANVRKYWFQLEQMYTALGNLTQDGDRANWSARVNAIRGHFRQTYRIRRPWMERIRNLRPYLLGIHDPVNGTRAVARAWSQYTVEPNTKCYVQAGMKNDTALQFMWLAVDNYPGFDSDLWTKGASPAMVSVVDEQAGILHVSYRQINGEVSSTIYPSLLADVSGKPGIPTRDLSDALRGVIAVNGKVKGSAAAPAGFKSDFRIALLVTAVPLAPNDERRMLAVDVDPASLPGNVRGTIQVDGGTGPEWNLLCPPGLLTAWYAHRSTSQARNDALVLFGFDQGNANLIAPPIPGGIGPPVPIGIGGAGGYEIINYGGTDDLIQGMANALATAQWAAFVDAREGSRTMHLAPSVALAGNIDSVRHTLDPDGSLLTTASMGQARRPIDPLALIPRASRPWILGVPEIPA